MSSSTTYRRVRVSAKWRAAIGAYIDRARPASLVVPKLVGSVKDDVAIAERRGSLSPDTARGLRASLEKARTVEAVGKIAHQVPKTAGASRAPLPGRPNAGMRAGERATSARLERWSALRWAITVEAAALRSIAEVAGTLGLDLEARIRDARRMLKDAVGVGAGGGASTAERLVTTVREMRIGLDERVEEALVAAEERRLALAEIEVILGDMGFVVEEVGDGRGGSRIVASAPDGTVASLRLDATGAGDHELVTTVTNLAHAVPPGHPAANEVCDPAVSMAEELHERLAEASSLRAGRVTTRRRPTRGHPDAVDPSASLARRLRRIGNPKHRSVS